MTVGELIRKLSDLPFDCEVYVNNYFVNEQKSRVTDVCLENDNENQWVLIDDYPYG